jgi:hypothetical protein
MCLHKAAYLMTSGTCRFTYVVHAKDILALALPPVSFGLISEPVLIIPFLYP